MQDDRLLLKQCQEGNRKAQYTLYERYKGRLFALCLRYMPSSEQAEDVLQESFIKIFRQLHTVQEVQALFAWMKRVTIRTALDHLKQKQRYFAPLEEIENVIQTAEMDGISHLSAQEIYQHIEKLPSGYRTVFNMYWIDGYDHAEIAEMLQISVKTSQSQLSRARAHLRNAMQTEFSS